MTIKNITDSINKIVISGLVLILALIFGNAINAKGRTDNDLSINSGIVGVWQLNRAASNKSIKQVSSKKTQLPPTLLFAPESLILAADEQISEITINEGFEKVIHTQTLPTDGTIVTKKVESIGLVSAKAFWKDKKLVVELATPNGDKMTEIFELSGNQKRLNVTLQVNDSSSAKPVTLRRIYNRLADQVEDNTADIAVVQNPF